MVSIKPFKALRPLKEKAAAVASLPYDVFSEAEARKEVVTNPESFLRVVRPETTMTLGVDPYDPSVYEKAKANLEALVTERVMVQDDAPAFYLYELIRNGRSQTGLVACCDVRDYIRGDIKKHELTREAKEQDRIRHINTCQANTGPVFLTYKGQEAIDALVATLQGDAPEIDFTADDGITHRVWVINDEKVMAQITDAFKAVDCLYIADGHHRAASAAKVAQMHGTLDDPESSLNDFLTVIFPADQLTVLDYNRVVTDLNGLSVPEFMEAVSEAFEVCEAQSSPYVPEGKGAFGMYLDDKWYTLKVKEGVYDANDPVESLDVSILQKLLLSPVLGIADPRTDPRIDFVGGIRGLGELERRVHEDMRIAFALYPTSVNELMAIADAGLLMPPKSTWFEPKLRSGLFVHLLG